MSSYFDKARSDSEPSRELSLDDRKNIALRVEHQVIADVSKELNDPAFPPELKTRIEQKIDRNRLETERGSEYFSVIGYSRLIEDLHSLFHDLARMRVYRSDGSMFSDNPRSKR